MPESVKPDHFSIQQALKNVDSGKWGIPSFQRSFVWTDKDIMHFLDSIFHEYPCGVLLLMPHEKNLDGRPFEGSSADQSPDYLILDGQQRLTSCYNALYNHGKEYKDGSRTYFYLDLKKLYRVCRRIGASDDGYDRTGISLYDDEIIVSKRRKKIPSNLEGNLVPFCMLRNDIQFSRFLEEYLEFEKRSDDETYFLKRELRTLIEPFSHYEFQALVLSEGMGLTAVCRIFETLNNTGTKLDSFDICVAKYMADSPGLDLKKRLEDSIREHPDLGPLFLKNQNKFENYRNREAVLQTIALYLDRDHRKNTLAESLEGDEVAENWDRAMTCLEQTVGILDKYAQTRSTMDLVPYSVAIPVIASVLMKCGKMNKSRKSDAEQKIVRYFFGTAFNERYADGASGKMAKDCDALYGWISRNDEPDGESCFDERIRLDMDDIRKIKKGSKGAVSLAMRCVFCSNGPEDFYGHRNVELGSADLHHLFPLNRYGDVDSILNLTYIRGSSNSAISDKSVRTYTDELIKTLRDEDKFKLILKRHFISGKTYECYRNEDYEGFIRGRFGEIAEYMRESIGLDVEIVRKAKNRDL